MTTAPKSDRAIRLQCAKIAAEAGAGRDVAAWAELIYAFVIKAPAEDLPAAQISDDDTLTRSERLASGQKRPIRSRLPANN